MRRFKTDIQTIVHWKILLVLSVIPLFFLPLTQEFYDTNKWSLLILLTLFTLVAWIYKFVRSRLVPLSRSPATVGLAALTLASVTGTIFSSPNKWEAVVNPFGPVTFFCLFLISLLFPAFGTDKTHKNSSWLLFTAASALSLISVYQFFGIGKTMFPGVPFLTDSLWTPTGSATATVAILAISLPLVFAEIRRAAKEQNEIALSFSILLAVIMLAGFGVTVWQTIPRLGNSMLPLRYGWAIMLEVLKNPRQAFFGVGADNFITAFSIGRPIFFNMTPQWAVRFTTNTNMLFHLITVYGLTGGAAFILFARAFFIHAKKDSRTLSAVVAFLSLLLVPPNLSLFVVTVLFLISQYHREKIPAITFPDGFFIVRLGISLVLILIVAASTYLFVRSYMGELTFFRSLTYARQNNGTATYNAQIAAIRLNPYLSRYHIIYSQTNMALATSLANSLSQTKTTDKTAADRIAKDRQLVAQLVQQAIAEAKAAVSLNPQNVLAWENLARTYTQLIGVAQGADNWAEVSYNQALQLDPTNPALYLELGTVYVQTKNYTNGITAFQRAAFLKQNYANAFYNLANAYKLNNDIPQAVSALEKTRSLIDSSSDDYKTVANELANLNKTQSASPSAASVTADRTKLTKPAPTPEVVPPLTLPGNPGP